MELGQFRLIHHLSYPCGKFFNDFIDPNLYSVQFASFDEAVHMVQDLGPCCLLGKSDIQSAFRLLPVSVLDFDQLGFKFDNKFYLAVRLPVRCLRFSRLYLNSGCPVRPRLESFKFTLP